MFFCDIWHKNFIWMLICYFLLLPLHYFNLEVLSPQKPRSFFLSLFLLMTVFWSIYGNTWKVKFKQVFSSNILSITVILDWRNLHFLLVSDASFNFMLDGNWFWLISGHWTCSCFCVRHAQKHLVKTDTPWPPWGSPHSSLCGTIFSVSTYLLHQFHLGRLFTFK